MALFLPALITQPELLAMSLGIAAAALIAAEVLRVGRCPFLGPRIHSFMTAFLDSRDQGLLLISHFSLLIGMALPLWLSLSILIPPSSARSEGKPLSSDDSQYSSGNGALSIWQDVGVTSQEWIQTSVPAFAFAGIMILGVADSAASAVGRRYGCHKLLRTHKSLEGTLGGIVLTLLGWVGLGVALSSFTGQGSLAGGVAGVTWSGILVAVAGSCLLEAVTTQLDNIFLPLHHLALLAV